MIEGIEKVFVVMDIFLGALNEAALLIGLAQDQMNPAHCEWDRPSFIASSPRLTLNEGGATRSPFWRNAANKKGKVFQ